MLWDRDCGFCAWMVSLLLRADGARVLRPQTIQSEEGERLLGDVPLDRRLASWHVVEPGGRRTSAGAALTTVLGLLPATRPLARLTGALPGVTDAAYRWVAAHRRLLSRPIPGAVKQRARRRVGERAAGTR